MSIKIYCHPDNAKILESQESKGSIHDRLFGIEIITDQYLPKYALTWKFPATRFIDYEKSDEVWAIPIKYGGFVETDNLVFYVMSDWAPYELARKGYNLEILSDSKKLK